MRCCPVLAWIWVSLVISPPSGLALDRSQVLFQAPFEGSLRALVAAGSPAPLPGLKPDLVPGIRGQAVRLGKSTWGDTATPLVVRMPVDVGLWRSYGDQESLGPLRYAAPGNIREAEGTLSFWLKPLGWELPNARDHFAVNLGMRDTLAIAYFTYFGCFSFQNSVGETTYKRCIAYLPPARPTTPAGAAPWTHVAVAWRDDVMKTWLNGNPMAVEREGVIPLRNATGEIRFGSGDHQEAAYDEVTILAQAAGDADAKALYRRDVPTPDSTLLSVPPLAPPSTLDGTLSGAEEWRQATRLSAWADTLLGVANRDRTEVWVGHDQSTLYVAFAWPVPDAYRAERTKFVGCPLKITQKDKDADLATDDVVGVRLSPPGGSSYLFAVNAGGARRDEKDGDPAWDGSWQTAQSWDDRQWLVEFGIPLQALAPTTTPDAEWGINFVHHARQVEVVDSVWCFQPAQLRPLARARLASAGISCLLSQVGDLSDGEFRLAAQVTNYGNQPVAVRAEVSLDEDGKPILGPERRDWSLAPAASGDWSVATMLTRPLYGSVLAQVTDAQAQVILRYRLPFVFSRELKLEAQYVPTPQQLQAVLDFGSTSTLGKASTGRLQVRSRPDGKVLLTQPLAAFARVRETVTVDCRALPVGEYEAVAEVTVGGATVTMRDEFAKGQAPEWLGNRLGSGDQVPPPWSPLRTQGRQVSCWGRDYTFGAAGLPAALTVLGQGILAGPARLVLTVGGRTAVVPDGEVTVSRLNDCRATVAASTRLEGVAVRGNAWIEFDGFCWNTLEVEPQAGVSIEGLAMEFPLKPEYATLWWPTEYVPSGPGGDSPSQPRDSDPIDGMRLGDEERGLQFSFANTRNWGAAPGQGQQLRPGPTEYVVRYNLVGPRTVPDAPLRFSFGLQALPSRPRSPYFRQIDFDACWSGLEQPDKAHLERTGKQFAVRPIYTEGWSRHWNYMNFWNREVFEPEFIERVRNGVQQSWQTSRNTLCLYLNVSASDANTPEYRTYRHEWRPVPGEAPYVAPDPATRDQAKFASVCVGAASYTDFYMWCLDRTLRALSDGGQVPVHVYLDNSGQTGCANALHGCPPDGHTNQLAHREYVKRLYTIVKAVNPINQVLVHCSGDNRMCSWSFSDLMIEGEQMTAYYQSQIANDASLPKDYTRLITLAKARSQFQSLAYGPDRLYLYQFWGWNKSEPHEAGPARAHLWGLMMAHDSPCWAAGNAPNLVRATEDLGWDSQTEFIPYWRGDNGIRLTPPAELLVASGWRHGDGNLMVLVLNDGTQPRHCSVGVDLGRFGFRSRAVTVSNYGHGGLPHPDSLKPQEVRTTGLAPGQAVELDVAEHSYQLLRFH